MPSSLNFDITIRRGREFHFAPPSSRDVGSWSWLAFCVKRDPSDHLSESVLLVTRSTGVVLINESLSQHANGGHIDDDGELFLSAEITGKLPSAEDMSYSMQLGTTGQNSTLAFGTVNII